MYIVTWRLYTFYPFLTSIDTPQLHFLYPMEFYDVSSTDLREHHSKNNKLEKVEKYIKENGLYN